MQGNFSLSCEPETGLHVTASEGVTVCSQVICPVKENFPMMWSQISAHVGVIVSYTSVSYSNRYATVTYVDFYGEILLLQIKISF